MVLARCDSWTLTSITSLHNRHIVSLKLPSPVEIRIRSTVLKWAVQSLVDFGNIRGNGGRGSVGKRAVGHQLNEKKKHVLKDDADVA